MSKAIRKPSRTKSLKNGYYFSISGSVQSLKPIRLMRSSKFEINIPEKDFKNNWSWTVNSANPSFETVVKAKNHPNFFNRLWFTIPTG